MEVQFEPAVQAQLDRIARESGRPAVALVNDAVAGYMGELIETRQTLDRRYDEIKSGRVKLIDGEEAFAELHRRIDARHNGLQEPSTELGGFFQTACISGSLS